MKRKHIIAYVVAFAGITLTGILSYNSLSNGSVPLLAPYAVVKQKGVCWVGGREVVTQKEIEKLKECGVTWISQTPFGWQEHVDSPSIRFETNSDRMWWGESAKGIAVTTQLADSAGIKVMLKPHLWARGGWPGDINMKSQTDWNEWFSQYSDFILTYARLAEELKIPILCIGTELHHSSKQEKSWRELIKKIRLAYRGKLTYAANFHEEFEHVKFWDALDYIGIQGYYPLAKKNDPKLEDMLVMWNAHLKNLEKVHLRFNKPVLFTEIGYRSTSDAAIEPWRWPQQEI